MKISADVQNLGELVRYQQNAVVSKTLLKKATGTVTLFAFDRGETLSEHTAAFDALIYVVEGRLQITVSGTGYSVAGGQTLLMPAHEPHSLTADEPSKMLLIMLRE